MCLGKGPDALSRMGILIAFICLATFVVAFVSTGWVYTKEPYRLPNLNIYTSITFKIGLWRICHSFRRINSTIIVPMPSCTSISYSNWTDISYHQLGLFTPTEFTLNFVSKIRWSTVFSGFGLLLLIIGTVYSIAGHCYQDDKSVVASAIYTMSGLFLSTGIFVFVCMLTGSFNEDFSRYQKIPSYWSGSSNNAYDYSYGWCFFAASISCILSVLSAMCTVTAHHHRYQLTLSDIHRQSNAEESYLAGGRSDKACLVKLNCETTAQLPNAVAAEQPLNSSKNEILVKPDVHVTFVGHDEITAPESNSEQPIDAITSTDTISPAFRISSANNNNGATSANNNNASSNTLPNVRTVTSCTSASHRCSASSNTTFATLKSHHRFAATSTHQRRNSGLPATCSLHQHQTLAPCSTAAAATKVPIVGVNLDNSGGGVIQSTFVTHNSSGVTFCNDHLSTQQHHTFPRHKCAADAKAEGTRTGASTACQQQQLPSSKDDGCRL